MTALKFKPSNIKNDLHKSFTRRTSAISAASQTTRPLKREKTDLRSQFLPQHETLLLNPIVWWKPDRPIHIISPTKMKISDESETHICESDFICSWPKVQSREGNSPSSWTLVRGLLRSSIDKGTLSQIKKNSLSTGWGGDTVQLHFWDVRNRFWKTLAAKR